MEPSKRPACDTVELELVCLWAKISWLIAPLAPVLKEQNPRCVVAGTVAVIP